MDLMKDIDLPAPSSTGVKRSATVPRSGNKEKETPEFQEILRDCDEMRTMTKLVLASAQKLRTLMSAIMLTFRVETSTGWAQRPMSATKKFSELSKQLKEVKAMNADQIRQQIGVPHIHAFNGLVEEMLLRENDEAKQAAMRKQLAKYSWKEANLYSKVVKVEKMHEGKFKRLVMFSPYGMANDIDIDQVPIEQMHMGHFFLKVLQALRKCNTVKEMEGQAPSGDLERKLQQSLDSLDI